MFLNRYSSASLGDQSIRYLQQNMSRMAGLQEKISSGQNINRPSDDPVGLTRLLDLTNMLKLDERFESNIKDSISELNVADSSMGGMVEIIHRAKELAVQGANDTNNQDNLDALALEVTQLIDQLVQLGNTKIGSRYIYSGMKTDTPPFAKAGYDISYNGTPPNENFLRQAEIAQGVSLDLNVNGQSLLGTVTTAAGPPPSVTGGAGLFRVLTELKFDLEQGNKAGVRTRLDQLTTELNTVMNARSQIGATTNRAELTQSRIEDRKTTLTKQYASIQEVDMAKTISDLNFQENVFQASLGVSARIMQISLLDFLR